MRCQSATLSCFLILHLFACAASHRPGKVKIEGAISSGGADGDETDIAVISHTGHHEVGEKDQSQVSRTSHGINGTDSSGVGTWECAVDENHKDQNKCVNSGTILTHTCRFCPCDGRPGDRGCQVNWDRATSPGQYTGEDHLRVKRAYAVAGGIYMGLCAAATPVDIAEKYENLCREGHWTTSEKSNVGGTSRTAELERKERRALDKRTKYCITVGEYTDPRTGKELYPWMMRGKDPETDKERTASLVGPYDEDDRQKMHPPGQGSVRHYSDVMFGKVTSSGRDRVSGGCALFPKRVADGYFKASARCTISRGCIRTGEHGEDADDAAFVRNRKLDKSRLLLFCETDEVRCNRPEGAARVGHDYVWPAWANDYF